MSKDVDAHVVIFQRKVLTFITGLLLVALPIWIIAISTSYWIIVGVDGVAQIKGHDGVYFLQSHFGIWRTCLTAFFNSTRPTLLRHICSYIWQEENFYYSSTFTDYQRSVAALTVVVILLMVLALIFSIYTFWHTRYMYKRLTAACHIISACCVLAVLEMTSQSSLSAVSSAIGIGVGDISHNFGYSYMLGWVAFVIEVLAAFAFAWFSRRKKLKMEPFDDVALEDQPTILGR